jgi:hypothetical protein
MANPHPIAKLYPEPPYHAKNAVKSGVNGALIGGAAGLIAAAVQNSLAKSNVGAGAIFTRSGAAIATLSTPEKPLLVTH